MLKKGYVKLHRTFLDWEWYGDINTSRLFLHLLLVANHEPEKWRGVTIERGQRVAGRAKLAEETGLTEDEIRTALRHLQATGEITSKTTNKYTVITIVNYDKYQDNPQQNPQQVPSKNDEKNDAKSKMRKQIPSKIPSKKDELLCDSTPESLHSDGCGPQQNTRQIPNYSPAIPQQAPTKEERRKKLRNREEGQNPLSDESDEPKPPKKIFADDSIEMQLSALLLCLMRQNNPTCKEPNLQGWCRHIDLMLRVDKRTPEQIRAVIQFSQKDVFWRANILSTGKLREKFDQLYLKSQSPGPQAGKGGWPPADTNPFRALRKGRESDA